MTQFNGGRVMFLLAAALAVAAPVPKPSPDWVTVRGTVVWPEKEKVPEAKALDLTAVQGGDAEYLRKGGAVFEDAVEVDGKTRGLKNVIVWVRPDGDDPKAKLPADRIHPDLAKAKPATHTVTSEFGRFDRRLVLARAGDAVKVVNKGEVAVAPMFSFDADARTHTMLPGKDPVTVDDLPAGVIPFRDLLHQGWLNGVHWPPGHGVVRAFDHPYFALTNDRGEFELKLVPKGKCRVVYLLHGIGWHKGKDGRLGVPVEVKGDDKGEMELPPLAFERPKAE